MKLFLLDYEKGHYIFCLLLHIMIGLLKRFFLGFLTAECSSENIFQRSKIAQKDKCKKYGYLRS